MLENQLSRYGAIAKEIPFTMGKVFFVLDPAQSYLGDFQNEFPADKDGVDRVYTSLASAYAATVSGRNDIIVLDANSTHDLTEMLTVSKNRVNFLGIDVMGSMGGGRLVTQGAKVQLATTGVATDLAPILVTGVRCSFKNLKVINASTTNQTLYGFIDNGEGTLIENCQFVKTTGLDDANHAHFWMAGDSLTMRDCVMGQSNTPNTAAGFGILIDGKTGGATDGTVKENFLENIIVNMSVGGSVQATSCFIKIADSSALNFGNVINGFIGSNFIPSGGSAMTDAVLGANSTVAGVLNLVSPAFFGCTGVGAGASQGVNIAARGVAPVAAGGLSTALTD